MTARFTGVSKRTAEGTFVASIQVQGKTVKLGGWLRELDAAVAFDRAALWFGRVGSLNLPSESRALGPCSPEELRRIALGQRKQARGASRLRGVTFSKRQKKWSATARVNSVRESVAGFASDEDAAVAYDRLLLGLGGDRAKLNFPDQQHAPASGSELRAELHALRKSNLTSDFRGVCLGPNHRWYAEIGAEGRRHRLGEWAEEVAAAEAYDRAALFFRGAAAQLNFPDRSLEPCSPADLRAEALARSKATRTSLFFGVCWVEAADGHSGWRAEIRRDGVLHTIRADDELDAAVAYDRLARWMFGAAAKLNFPDEAWPAASLEELRRERRAAYKQTTTSRFHCVSWAEHVAAWLACIKVDHVYYFLGYHDDEEMAARAQDRKRRELGSDGPYNFPDELPGAKARKGRTRR